MIENKDIIKIINEFISFPYPQICKHLVACRLLSLVEEKGEAKLDLSALAKSLVNANDEESLRIIQKLTDIL